MRKKGEEGEKMEEEEVFVNQKLIISKIQL